MNNCKHPVATHLFKYLFTLVILFGIQLSILHAQYLVPQATHFNVSSGLADYTPTGITQDPSGMVWVSTRQGLQRFDGMEFMLFNRSPENPYKISNNEIEEIYSCRDSFILIQYASERTYFDLLNHQNFELRKIQLSPKTGIQGTVLSILPDPNGAVYCLTKYRNAIHLYRATETFQFQKIWTITVPPLAFAQEASLIRLPAPDQFLVASPDYGVVLVQNGRVAKKFDSSDFGQTRSIQPITLQKTRIFTRDQSNRVWVSFQQNSVLYRYNPATKTFTPKAGLPQTGEYTYAWQDLKGRLIVIQTNGMGRYPVGIGVYMIRIDHKVENLSQLLHFSPFPSAVYASDFTQTVFWGMDSGLKIFQNSIVNITHFLAGDVPEDKFGESVRGMTSDDNGHVYITGEGTYWFRYNTNTGQFDTLQIIEETTGQPLAFDCSMNLFYEKGVLWGAACQGLGKGIIIRFDLQKSKARIYRYPKRLKFLVPTDDGKILAITFPDDGESHLLLFDPSTAQFEQFQPASGANPLLKTELNYIYKAAPNQYWICTNMGLYNVNLHKRTIEQINPDGKSQNRNFQVVEKAPDGTYWLGTTTGLLKYNSKTNQIQLFNKSHGFSNEWICGILNDARGNSWFSTYYGITSYLADSDRFINYYRDQGLSHNSMNRYSFFKDNQGIFYFGSINGLNIFNPDSLLYDIQVPKVVPIKLSWLDQRTNTLYEIQKPVALKKINLPPQARFFSLEFALPVFYNAHSNRFKVKLQGLEKNWTLLINQRSIRYSRIPPGHYTLRILGSDPQGFWSQEELTIPIYVERIFYQSWWFILMISLSVSAIIYLILRARWNQKLEMERLRTRISSDIHDEVSGLLAGISMQSELLNLKITDPSISKSVTQITEVSRKAMAKLSDVLWSIDSRRDSLEDLLLRMHEDAEYLLAQNGIEYIFEKKDLPLNKKLNVQNRQDIYFIYKELLNNIVKHSKASHVHIQVIAQDVSLLMKIQDDGAPTQQSLSPINGQGIQNMGMRAKRLHADLTLDFIATRTCTLYIPGFFSN